MTGIFIVAVICAVALALWLHFDTLHRFALASARKHCQDMEVQLLDQTLVLRGLRLARGESAPIIVVTTYGFEFSTTGERRYQGLVKFAGKKRLHIELEPHVV